MKNFSIYLLITFFTFSCSNFSKTKDLKSYLQHFDTDLIDYKIICIVPADGCGSCIDRTLKFSKKTKNDLLLIITSIYNKSIESTLKLYQIEKSAIISDNQNLAISNGLVQLISPCIYLIKSGKVIQVIDLSNDKDQDRIFEKVEKHLSVSD